MNWCQFQN